MPIYIVQREVSADSRFGLAWAFTSQEQLFEFFHGDVHEELRHGLDNFDMLSMFEVQSGPHAYRVSQAVVPVYMALKN